MLIEVHLLQNFAPSNLNRDDTGSPKDCEFGGYRRARISSQCLKRAIRQDMKGKGLLPREELAVRTKRVVDEALAPRLMARGRDEGEAKAVATAALYHAGLDVKQEDGKTEYLLFMGAHEIGAVAALCDEQWDRLLTDGQALQGATATGQEETGGAKRGKAAKNVTKDKAIGNAVKALLDGGKAADLALFGRMIADLPERNVDGSCQVAHALSTNTVNVEFDFYTAVDDLKPEDTAGADMLGTVEFNSACYYRYANVDVAQLAKNLHGDDELTRKTVEAFLRASINAIPTGKQNSMAAQNPPSLVFIVVRNAGMWSLANAFVQPVRPNGDGDLIYRSVLKLDKYWSDVAKMYGDGQIVGKWLCMLDCETSDGRMVAGHDLRCLGSTSVDNIDILVGNAMRAITADGAA